MIDLYTWASPNGRKVSIMLEECGLAYRVVPVDLSVGAQKSADFSALNPNQRVPAIFDHDGENGELILAESGAILIYLAEKTGSFLPASGVERARVLQWLMFQMAHVGPTLGQADHFLQFAEEKLPYAIERFVTESIRVLGVLDSALALSPALAGDYSIADIACYPWVEAAWQPMQALNPNAASRLGNLARWRENIGSRPAVLKGMAVPA